MDLDNWTNTFKSWPNQTPGWREWFFRMSNSKRVFWDERKIGHCINLSLSHMERNDSLLIAASYFWSDALNAFLFGHGSMTPTLADVLMLTGLDISSADTPFDLLIKPTHRLETKAIGG